MKKIIVLLLFLAVIGFSPPIHAQNVWATGSITAADSTCAAAGSCVTVNLPVNTPAVTSFTIAGTFSGTLTFKVSQDCTTFITVNSTPPNSTTAVTSTTGTGTWKADVAGMCKFRVEGTSLASGSATVSISISNAMSANLLGVGGGGGAPTGPAGGDLTGTYPNPTIAANAVTFAKQATQATNTVTGNYTSGTAVPTAGAAPSGGTSGCSGSTDAVIYTTNTGWGCHQIAGGSAQWSYLSSGNTTGGLFTTGTTIVELSGFQQGTAGGSGNSAITQGGTPGAGTVAGVFFAIRTAPGGAVTLTLTVNKNGTPTTMTCIITSAITSCSDITHTFTVNDTDRITYSILSNGTPAGGDVWNIRLKMTP